ncbi:hypothetical protein MON38_04990 [Hymenobacter sp. DH14]|uniref:Uncharacterized protein n=1 Tax=Hymenobacter cyanobacteriorum TaxID=2926463 RepID=A0A9X1VCT1_9BACT|nr:hypothetical protein [Hymenobacter cyanobacteriorum]MCI1186764.1 hypothetical protein [Hymenobacter cyanobacteriorum]
MWLLNLPACGRFLMGAAVLLSLDACKHNSAKTTEAATSATGSALDTSRAVRPTAQLPPAAQASQPTQAVGDSISPVILRTWPLSRPQWDSLNTEWNDTTRLVRSQVVNFAGFRLVQESGERPRLFHRVASGGAEWMEIDLSLVASDTEDAPQWGAESGDHSIDTVNLDGRGAAELVLRLHPASYGTGSGTAWDQVSVLDVTSTPTPTLIFQALLAAEDEALGGYAMMHGYKIEPGEQFTGCKRSFRVQHRELLLGPVKTIGNTKPGDCTLTKLSAGRYRYQHGKVLRVGK